MSNEKQAAQGSAATAKKLAFKDMSPRQKTVFILKLTLSIVTFGLAFPNLMNE